MQGIFILGTDTDAGRYSRPYTYSYTSTNGNTSANCDPGANWRPISLY